MGSFLHPVGSLPPSAYWFRRAVVVVVVLLLAAGGWLLLSGVRPARPAPRRTPSTTPLVPGVDPTPH